MAYHAYWMPWRPIYEGYALLGWLAGAAVNLWLAWFSDLPADLFKYAALACLVLAGWRAIPTWRLFRWRRNLRGRSVEVFTLEQLQRRCARHPDAVWLGRGFEWRPEHAQRIHEIMARQRACPALPSNATAGAIGASWLQGVGGRETDILLPLAHQAGHVLLVGTTRSFKTKQLLLLIAQAIFRGEAVIVIDPKGDRAVRQTLQAACQHIGKPEKFVFFHPAFPDRSIRIDPLRHFNNFTEVASRIAALIPSETGSDPFKAFGWDALNNLVGGLLEVAQCPSLLLLRHYVQAGPDELLARALRAYGERHVPDCHARLTGYLKPGKAGQGSQLAALVRFYHEVVVPLRPSPSLEGLISMVHHDREHFSKMVASLIPVLGMLTAPPLDELLSPDHARSDPRPVLDMARLIDQSLVAYIGLDSLSNSIIGSAIGSLLLADLTATVGSRYNYGTAFTPVNVVVDEAAEVINEPMIALLNKSGGAGVRMIIATQTLADFEARLGSPAKARQVLGNVNSRIVGRVLDAETQVYIAESLPKTRVLTVQPSQGATSDASQPVLFTGGFQESVTAEEAALFAPEWLGLLPNLEWIALLSASRVLKGRLPVLQVDETLEVPPCLPLEQL